MQLIFFIKITISIHFIKYSKKLIVHRILSPCLTLNLFLFFCFQQNQSCDFEGTMPLLTLVLVKFC